MSKNYYKILGVEKGIDSKDLRKKYLSLVKQYHPDTNKDPGAEDKFKEIQEAYEAISEGRADSHSQEYEFQHGSPFGFPFGFGNGPIDLGQFGQFQTVQQMPNPNIEREIEIEFLTAAIGGDVIVKYEYDDQCTECKDHFDKNKDFKYDTCKTCNGKGSVVKRNQFMSLSMTCHMCLGRGKTIDCNKCGGSKFEKKSKTINIRMPVGIDHRRVLKVSGGGNFNYQTNKYGDLFIRVIVRNDARFRRDGLHIFSNINVDYIDCILGAEIETETIHGKVRLEIPAYTQNKTVITSADSGIKLVDKNLYGNHYFTINVSIPSYVSEKDKKYLRKIRGKNKN